MPDYIAMCPRCAALPGKPCLSVLGKPIKKIHAERAALLKKRPVQKTRPSDNPDEIYARVAKR